MLSMDLITTMQDIDATILPQGIVRVVRPELYVFQMVSVNKQMERLKII